MTDDEDDPDPFEDFDKPTDDEGDPFADLGADDEAPAGEEAEASSPGESRTDRETEPGRLPDDPFTDREAQGPDRPPGSGPGDTTGADTGTEIGDDASAPDEDGPGTAGSEPSIPETEEEMDPFADLGGGPQPRTKGAGDDDPFETFESVDVGEVDPDEIWANLSSLEEDDDRFDGKVYYEVSKHRFCEQCQYFSGPPEAQCTFDGADIVEFVDMETVRLVNCPIVAEQEELGEDVTRYEPE